jgi:hypothetical protein
VERLRSEFDGDRMVTSGPSRFKSYATPFEVRCGMCGRISFVDEVSFRSIQRATEAGLDSPFSCDLCQDEYDELAYEG